MQDTVVAGRGLDRDGARAAARTSSALIIAHPGHELRVHRWLETRRPHTFVLTDGSGHGERGRLDSTRRVLDASGARMAAGVFGRWSDRDIYRLILDRRFEPVRDLVLEIADQLLELGVDEVVSDAVEGFNPTHDLCYVVAECAVALASSHGGREIRHLDFPLEAAPSHGAGPAAARYELDDDALERKLDAARAYDELGDEVERALAAHSAGAFAVEVLSVADPGRDLVALATSGADTDPNDPKPRYEIFGERRVASGTYREVLRLREHWLPLAEALRAWAAGAR